MLESAVGWETPPGTKRLAARLDDGRKSCRAQSKESNGPEANGHDQHENAV
jgi:hypothetical protein